MGHILDISYEFPQFYDLYRYYLEVIFYFMHFRRLGPQNQLYLLNITGPVDDGESYFHNQYSLN